MTSGWEGTWTALVTPFREDGHLDLPALERLVEDQIEQGVEGLLACGSTGEAAMLEPDEWERVVATVVRRAAGRRPVLAGTGQITTTHTIHRTRLAADLGVQGVLVVTPPYVKAPQEGLARHFRDVASATALPLVAYSVPSRTGSRLEASTVERLHRESAIAALKDASGDLRLASSILSRCDLPLLSGDDELTLPILSLGGCGVVSVASNLVPRRMGDLVRAFRAGNLTLARTIHRGLFPLLRGLGISTNPVPIKAALARMGRVSATIRPPLVPLEEPEEEALEAALEAAGLLAVKTAPAGGCA